MKITKYVHSCLLFEQDGYQLLFDPGNYTFADNAVHPGLFNEVDAIIVTHVHADHLDTGNLQKIISRSGAAIYTNTQVGDELDKEDIPYNLMEEGEYELGPFKLKAFSLQHEPLLNSPLPQMTGFIINDKVLHPVDSMEDMLTEHKNIELLLMVTMAPFASEVQIANFAEKIQPKQIFPVHDGYAMPGFVKARQKNYANYFAKMNIRFNELYEPGSFVII
ncbi:MBL fold metallo-hydrolase [Mucilaginibacter segetis]|uniref:MBL fold metallo-hydrolase n=1 Tax=Mucilaginibacter segetis TaxID=2793071 RepID=A0A934ULY1_9SPHI|nr:MBL fold metallo-hydrolase [Mucilaginibacter segetis]MBK0378307.1 MBL fold metallo-hydrolase [Mucilaginibacter segetis]